MKIAHPARRRPATRSGFTLIEIMAVLLILSILITFLVRSVSSGQRTMEMEATRALLTEIGGMIEEYKDELGAYPPSTFPGDLDPRPSNTNQGAESLVIELWRKGRAWQARAVGEDMLGNTDEDSTKSSVTTYTSADAFELCDRWENPIAYLAHGDYGKEQVYLTLDASGASQESKVKALRSAKTGDPFRKASFQLISAGPDGLFGNGDDVHNFETERE
jgi:prepilin-type N-terminal cleavage/methylation domain-containing protein